MKSAKQVIIVVTFEGIEVDYLRHILKGVDKTRFVADSAVDMLYRELCSVVETGPGGKE